MAKRNNVKRILKITGGIIIFITLPTILFFGFLYFKYNEDRPIGVKTVKADEMAHRMLETLNYNAYKSTDYIEWTFKGRHHYKWYKSNSKCEVYWDNIKVILDLQNRSVSTVYVLDQLYEGIEKQKYVLKAEKYFNNDSFWLVAPYKIFDPGTIRRLVEANDGKDALLVTYTSGGSTPGDSYLWHFDRTGKPKSFQMWVDIIPIKGLEATWDNWTTTESGALLPTFHKLLFLGLEIDNIKGISL